MPAPRTEVPARQGAPVPASSAGDQDTTAPRREPWLLAQAPEAYTLQLLASNEARILDFIAEHGLQDGAAVFQSRAGEQPLFVVVYGVYATREEATRAMGRGVLQGLLGVTPWIRPFRDIQAVIAGLDQARSPASNSM